MKRGSTTTTAQRVGFIVPFSKRRCSLSLQYMEIISYRLAIVSRSFWYQCQVKSGQNLPFLNQEETRISLFSDSEGKGSVSGRGTSQHKILFLFLALTFGFEKLHILPFFKVYSSRFIISIFNFKTIKYF